jgi:hypothetical protein
MAFIACNTREHATVTVKTEEDAKRDTVVVVTPPADTIVTAKVYGNDRFRDVVVTRTGDHTYNVKGKARVFEAAFSWVIEDGHNELKEGHQMTDAGAPEFGNFDFAIDVVKEDPGSTLHLILFEASPKDGSRQSELPIPLP